ncbi:hypothetical protein [Lake Baikal phage Baikal-20-5m-C28]|nr:hypothetical protein [Lake Baikal phage Baikal-20-5m-C28]
MKFVDYYFDLLPDGSIMMDRELSPNSLQVKQGDKFITKIIDNQVFLFKEKVDLLPEEKNEWIL